MATTSKFSPDAIAASTNLTGSVANIQDDPLSPDGSWLTATSATAATDVRVTFPSPAALPDGTQRFNYYVRKTAGTPSPLLTSYLYQGGTLRATLENSVAVNSTTGELRGCDWSASALVTILDGSDVECRIAAAAGTSSVGGLPAYDAVGTAASSSTLAGTFNVTIPAHSAGDLLILHVLTRNSDQDGVLASINTANWTQAGGPGTTYGGNNNARSGFGWKIGDGSETSVSVTTTGSSTSDRRLARVYVFTASDGFASPPVINIATALAGTSTPASMPTVSTTTGGNMLAVTLLSSASSTTVGVSTGETGGDWTEPVSQSSGTNGTISIQISDQSSSASISGGTTAVGTTTGWVTIGFAIAPPSITETAINTVEVGAIRWNATHLSPPAGDIISGVFGTSGVFGGRIAR